MADVLRVTIELGICENGEYTLDWTARETLDRLKAGLLKVTWEDRLRCDARAGA